MKITKPEEMIDEVENNALLEEAVALIELELATEDKNFDEYEIDIDIFTTPIVRQRIEKLYENAGWNFSNCTWSKGCTRLTLRR